MNAKSVDLLRKIFREGRNYERLGFKSGGDSSKFWRDSLKEQFRNHRTVTDELHLAELQKDAEEYLIMLQSVKSYQGLLAKYNVMMDQRKSIEQSSKMVGLRVPESADEREKKFFNNANKELSPPTTS